MTKDKPNIRCYDNGGKTFDRYTVVYMDEPERERGVYAAIGASEYPFHPQGFGQHCSAAPGRHLGRRVPFESLPPDVQRMVVQDTQSLSV